MKILLKDEIATAIHRCNPTEIAVAYVGADWRTFVADATNLSSIIVSPTVGSNPYAIAEIAKEIGWDKVFFLNELHAKIYCGKKSAVVGSANLTSNGLSGTALAEACVEVDDPASLRKLGAYLEELKERAEHQYPSQSEKEQKLRILNEKWNAGFTKNIFTEQTIDIDPPPFENFNFLGGDSIYVLWYLPEKCEYSREIKELEAAKIIEDDLHFTPEDEVKRDHWALVWRLAERSKRPDLRAKPYWFYIHDFYRNGVVKQGYAYTTCAIQRSDLSKPTPPFELTAEVVEAFRACIIQEDIAEYLIQDPDDVFELKRSLEGIPLLIDRMREHLATTTSR